MSDAKHHAPTLTTSLGLLVLRLAFGGYMVTHGWAKVQMIRAGQYEMMGDPIGLGPTASLWLVAAAEFGCAILVMLGLGTRLAALPIAFAMGVAALVAHKADPWTMGGAYELFMAGQTKMPVSKQPAVLFLAAFLALALTGAGRLSLDNLIARRWRRRKA